MILGLSWALAADPTSAGTAVRAHTAETLAAGDVVVRWPAGRSMVGWTDRVTAFVAPFDLTIGGPRGGVEVGAPLGERATVSLSPSIGWKATGKRGSLRLEAQATWSLGDHTLTAQLAGDARWLRQLVIDDEARHAMSYDRLQSHALGTWDTPHSRVKLRVPLTDQGQGLRWGSAAVAWVHTTRRVHLAAGVGLLVGRPFDRYTLGHYQWWFWMPYPEVDLALRF